MDTELLNILSTPQGQIIIIFLLYKAIQWLISQRTEDKTDFNEEIKKINQRIEELDSTKTSKETCEERHKNQDRQFGGFEKTLERIETKLDKYLLRNKEN